MKINVKKVLLIVPPAFTFKVRRDINPLPPMGLGYLASVVEKMGIEVQIIDCLVRGWNHEEAVDGKIVRVGLTDKEIETLIAEFDPDLVGITCQYSRQYRIYHQIFSLVKKVKPTCITVAGGAHVTVCPKEVLSDHFCDFIIVGEAEGSFREFLEALIQGSEFNQIDGLGWKINGNLFFNEKQKWIIDLDSNPFPAYHLMELDRYFGLEWSHGMRHKKKFSPIITSRGCPAKCTFCSAYKVWGKKYRLRSVDNVIEEMKLLRNQYGIEELMFEDDNVTADSNRAKRLFSRMVEENLGFLWDTPNGVGVWSMDEELLDLMKESGCVKLNFPVESGSQIILDNIIKKPLKLSKIPRLIDHCRKIKLDYGMFLVIGMPGEKVEDMWKSFRFAADSGCYNPHISIATPYPGSKLFDTCVEKKFFSREFSLDDLFIRSFIIETPDWDEYMLRQMFLKGKIYLSCRKMISDPKSILNIFLKFFKRPKFYYRRIKQLMNY